MLMRFSFVVNYIGSFFQSLHMNVDRTGEMKHTLKTSSALNIVWHRVFIGLRIINSSQ